MRSDFFPGSTAAVRGVSVLQVGNTFQFPSFLLDRFALEQDTIRRQRKKSWTLLGQEPRTLAAIPNPESVAGATSCQVRGGD